MTDLEDVIRDTLTAHALQAPDAEGLVDSVRGRRGHRRRARTLITVAAVAAATTAAVVVPLTLTGHVTARPAHKPSPAPAPGPTAKDQVIGFHGVEVTVPSSWKINAVGCGGEPADNTVIRDLGASPACEGGRAGPRISSVTLDEVSANARKYLHDLRPATNAGGVHVQRGTYAFSHGVAVVVPAADVLVVVDATTITLRERIIDSLRMADTDVTGCLMHQRRLDPPRPSGNPDALGAPIIFPPRPSSIAVCHYSDYWLVSSATATGVAASDIVRVANSVPAGWDHGRKSAPLASCTEPESPGSPAGQGYVLFAHYADGLTVTAWAHIGLCGRLGITNGAWTGQLTPELAAVITRPLRNGYEMPGSLLPGPG